MKQNRMAVCTIGLIGINVAIFLIIMLMGENGNVMFLLDHGAMYEPYIVEGHEYYRVVTSLFLHFDAQHLLNNMLLLGALGWYLELECGKIQYLLVYFLSGIGGNVISLFIHLHRGENVISAGASGAIFGLMGALACVVILNRGHLGRLSTRGMVVLVVLSLYFSFAGSGIDNAAHVGGLICGFVLEVILRFCFKRNFYFDES